MLDLDRSVRVLVNRERVDHAHRLIVMQSLSLSDDLPVELAVAEAKDDQLDSPIASDAVSLCRSVLVVYGRRL
jgi:hypothetical protein